MTASSTPYGQIVLEHFRRPRNQRSLDNATLTREGFNPLCGDRVRIELELDGSTIHAAAFTANACAICTASASLLTVRLTGSSVEQAERLTDGEILAALGGEVPVGRVDCALLPVQTLRRALGELRPQP